MAKKNVKYSDNVVIKSSEHAQEMSERLPSILSQESLLSQRTLIYVAKLLEEQNALLALIAHRSPPKTRVQRIGLWARFKRWIGSIVKR
jgi:hypothetical protein